MKRQDEAEPQVVLAAAASGAEVRRLKKAGKSSSLVLVSNSNVEAAAEPVTDSSGGGPSEGEGGEASPAAARAEAKATKKASRSGGAPPGGGGGPRAPTPAIDRAFNQDDLMAALMVLALLLLAAMYFMRGNGAKAPQPLMQAANIQPAAVPAPAPVGPPPDPHGDKPIDLTPKSAMPAPAPEPVCPSSHTLRAWFCTDQTQLTDAAKASLEKDLADWGQCFKNKELQVAGYADTRGPSEYNTSLGGARATVVAEYLKSKGIRVAGMKGIGELSGLTDNENCANQRRVDITFAGEESEAPMRTCAPPKDFAELVCG